GKGVMVVAAAGNRGTTTQFFPAADPRAISVAATTVTDRRYSWSNFGPWVRMAAPGCNVAPILAGGYGTFCGTSSASPVVAGRVALGGDANRARDRSREDEVVLRPPRLLCLASGPCLSQSFEGYARRSAVRLVSFFARPG